MNDSNTTSVAGAAVCVCAFLLLTFGFFMGWHSHDDDKAKLQELQSQNAKLEGELQGFKEGRR